MDSLGMGRANSLDCLVVLDQIVHTLIRFAFLTCLEVQLGFNRHDALQQEASQHNRT